MVWFEAGVLGAISKAKAESRLFVVLVVDGTEQSAVLESRLLHDEVAEFISQNAVALRLEAASPDSQAFFQIYPASEIPALYFINPANGTLLAAEGEADAAPSQILASLELHLASVRAWSQPEPPPGPSSTNEAESTAQSQGAPAGGDRAGQVARLRELAKESLQRKEREREQDQREQERRKREEAKELAKLREDRERAQALQAAEQLKRSRREEEEARRKIKEQIASDRAERASRQVPHGPQQARHQEAAPEAAERQQGIVNLQVKLTDGTSLRSTFEADAPLSSVRRFIEERRTDGRDPYIMLMTHPYRHFTELDMASTLSDLGLFPNGTIILKPTPVVSHAFSGASVSRVPPSARAPLSVGLVLQDMLRSFLDTIRGLIASLRGSANPAGLEEEARAGTEPPRAERARPAPEPGRVRGLRDLTGGGGRTSDRQEQQFYNGNSLSFDG